VTTYQHVAPLRTLLQLADDLGDMGIARSDIGITGMLIEVALRFVKCHAGNFPAAASCRKLLSKSFRCCARLAACLTGSMLAK